MIIICEASNATQFIIYTALKIRLQSEWPHEELSGGYKLLQGYSISLF